jgi:hypothetical protein
MLNRRFNIKIHCQKAIAGSEPAIAGMMMILRLKRHNARLHVNHFLL